MDSSIDLKRDPIPETNSLGGVDVSEAHNFSPYAWKPPFSLRIVAFTFVLFGILSIVDVVLRWLILSEIFLNFGCLFVLVGWGLRRWSKVARSWAVLLSWFTLMMLVVWLFLTVYAVSGGELPSNFSVHDTSLRAIVVGCLCIAYLIWQLRVLRRADIVQKFESLEFGPRIQRGKREWWKPHRWQFSLESMLLATIAVAFVIVDVQSRELWWNASYQTQHSQSVNGNEMRRADSIVAVSRLFDRPEKLRCLLLTRGDDVGHSISARNIESSDGRLIVHFRGGKELILNEDHQLYQIDENELRHVDARVTKTEFDKYVDSQPSDWSIESLVEFARISRSIHVEDSPASEVSD